jgi:peptidyl-prolyl cis-trans isomerase SurA
MKFLSAILIVFFVPINHFPAKSQEVPVGTTIDEVVAVVGKHFVLLSDIESQYLQMRMQGSIQGSEENAKCQILENLLFEKLLLHQAALDSIELTPEQVNSELDRRMRYFIQQFGSQEKLEEYYNKSIIEFKDELREVIGEQLLIGQVQDKITEKTQVSPSEVRKFFRNIPKDSIPLISSEVEIAQVVKKPVITPEERFEVKERLKKMRERVLKGESFSALAVLYSEDPGSAKQGGDIGLRGRGELYPEFEAVAFKLNTGEISEIVETEAGYHIIEGIERRGEFVRVRHILLRPKVSPYQMAEAREFLDSIASLIRNDSIGFEDAVKQFSTDPSKNNNGLLINPYSGSSMWPVDELNPRVFFVIDKLNPGDISAPTLIQDEKGEEAYALLMLRKRTLPHRANLEEDYNQIQEWALLEKRQETVINWISKNLNRIYIKINENYHHCRFQQDWLLTP